MTANRALSALVALAALGLAPSAHATLINRGGGLIYDTDRNITWLANANQGAGSSFDDGPSATDGAMSWASALAWADNLSFFDSVRNKTWDDWRLPSTLPLDPTCGTPQLSSGFNCTGSELGHLAYVELSGLSNRPISGSGDADLALFTNLQNDGYWSGTGFDAGNAWVFNFEFNAQGPDNKNIPVGYFAIAVRDGDVAPEPSLAWLLGSGALVSLAWAQRRR
jgi:hypothetical protein